MSLAVGREDRDVADEQRVDRAATLGSADAGAELVVRVDGGREERCALVSAGIVPTAEACTQLRTLMHVDVPEVLSMREFRARLAATVARVTGTGSPVFVGGYRKPEVVIMSVEQYESLVRAARQREAVAEALASVRAEGLEPSVESLGLLERIANGGLAEDAAIEILRGRYQR